MHQQRVREINAALDHEQRALLVVKKLNMRCILVLAALLGLVAAGAAEVREGF